RAVRVRHQRQLGEAPAHRLDERYVATGLDLDLDAPVARRGFARDRLDERGIVWLQPDRDARLDLAGPAPQHAPERLALAPRPELEHGHLERGLGHLVPAHAGEGGSSSRGWAISSPSAIGARKSRSTW